MLLITFEKNFGTFDITLRLHSMRIPNLYPLAIVNDFFYSISAEML